MKPSLNETTVTPSLIGFIDFPRFRRIVTEFLPSFVFFLTERWRIPFDWVLPFFYRVLLGLYRIFIMFYWVWLSFTVSLQSSMKLNQVLLFLQKSFDESDRVLPGFTGFYRVLLFCLPSLLGFTEIIPSSTKLNRVFSVFLLSFTVLLF